MRGYDADDGTCPAGTGSDRSVRDASTSLATLAPVRAPGSTIKLWSPFVARRGAHRAHYPLPQVW